MRNRNEFVQLIDRYRLGQAQRLSIGLTLTDNFQKVQSSLMLAEGRGKFLRPRWIENREVTVPDSIAKACERATIDADPGVREFAQLRVDLTRIMATAVNELATLSGVHSKMLLAACIDEPGMWIKDYDGKRTWQPFCEPEQHSELTGLTSIDALPGRDLAVGGRGWPLHPLPHWLLFADRNRTIADQPRLLINLDAYTELTWLPESDGLDDELPALRYARFLGGDFERRLLIACGQGHLDATQRDDLGAQGKVSTELSSIWNEFVERQDLNRNHPDSESVDALVDESVAILKNEGLAVCDALMTLASHVTIAIKRFLSKRSTMPSCELVMGGELARHGLLLSEINQAIGSSWLTTTGMNYDARFLRANAASLAGLMHIDQMPITIPWISGCDTPRVLGRLTPGSPGNWRRVIMEMGDCRPPVMKLRDAV